MILRIRNIILTFLFIHFLIISADFHEKGFPLINVKREPSCPVPGKGYKTLASKKSESIGSCLEKEK
jgi:hypothetical protein